MSWFKPKKVKLEEVKPQDLKYFSTIKELLDSSDRRRAAWPLYKKIYMQIKWKVDPIKYRFWSQPKQTIINGLKGKYWGPDQDSFDFYANLAKHAAPRLKAMKSYKSGYPAILDGPGFVSVSQEESDANMNKWLSMLDDMIYFLEEINNEDRQFDHDKDYRYRRGKYYMFKYFESLWN